MMMMKDGDDDDIDGDDGLSGDDGVKWGIMMTWDSDWYVACFTRFGIYPF